MPSEKSAEAIVVGATRRRAEPFESRELQPLEALWQKPRTEGLGGQARAGSPSDTPGAFRRSGARHKVEFNGTAGYGTVRPVVWEDGGG